MWLDHQGRGATQVVHSIDMEKKALQLVSSLEGVNLYSVCDTSSINEITPLIPFLDERFPGALEKSVHAIKDFILPPGLSKKYFSPKKILKKTKVKFKN
ncbi:hypothetical protein SAMN02745150_00217 [Brevinema andersonii]|uniref:Uncharacterized protein n=1 Tax=Brevinema andersonii TaxID=34097 RepID=A0A1I1D7P4_BREAD|nr:hypothetical protein [Brevinema andersonii]SFB68830.1 hypothetical protein SAMN02745150_00217 [Brevinema andersonii]